MSDVKHTYLKLSKKSLGVILDMITKPNLDVNFNLLSISRNLRDGYLSDNSVKFDFLLKDLKDVLCKKFRYDIDKRYKEDNLKRYKFYLVMDFDKLFDIKMKNENSIIKSLIRNQKITNIIKE